MEFEVIIRFHEYWCGPKHMALILDIETSACTNMRQVASLNTFKTRMWHSTYVTRWRNEMCEYENGDITGPSF